jgi:hypothetical protein
MTTKLLVACTLRAHADAKQRGDAEQRRVDVCPGQPPFRSTGGGGVASVAQMSKYRCDVRRQAVIASGFLIGSTEHDAEGVSHGIDENTEARLTFTTRTCRAET